MSKARNQMILFFRRTGQRRYAVEAERPGFATVEMNPAPGYDQQMPHDMMHLIVEAQLGLTRGIFGQLALGGTAGSFSLKMDRDEKSRKMTRTRKRVARRGKRLLKKGFDDCVESERAAYICWLEWRVRSSPREQRKQAEAMAKEAREARAYRSQEVRGLTPRKLEEICKHLDHLSSEWSRLNVGESMAVTWPHLTIVNGPEVKKSA